MRVREGKLVDATPEFCGRIFSEKSEDYRDAKSMLTPENLNKLRTNGVADLDNEEIVGTLLSQALQHVFCRQFDEALSDLNLLPDSSRPDMKAKFAEFIQKDYPEFAAKLRETAEKK